MLNDAREGPLQGVLELPREVKLMKWAALVPELTVLDLAKSLPFYTDLLGFEVVFSRPEPRFAYLQLGEAQLMLDQYAEGRGWETGRLEPPLGRGINLQIEVEALEPIITRLAGVSYPLFASLEEKNWYRQDDTLYGNREFLVQDPDGYLLRFSEFLETKPA